MCNIESGIFFSSEFPRTDKERSILENIFQENAIENVSFKQWISSKFNTLETLMKPSDLIIYF